MNFLDIIILMKYKSNLSIKLYQFAIKNIINNQFKIFLKIAKAINFEKYNNNLLLIKCNLFSLFKHILISQIIKIIHFVFILLFQKV
jgi:hypothetical protein